MVFAGKTFDLHETFQFNREEKDFSMFGDQRQLKTATSWTRPAIILLPRNGATFLISTKK